MATTWYHFLVRIKGNESIYYLFDFILLHTYVRMCAYVCMCTYASLHPFLMMNVASMHCISMHCIPMRTYLSLYILQHQKYYRR